MGGRLSATPLYTMDMKTYMEILLILFGWALGMLSTLLFEMIKKNWAKIEVRKGFKSELEEFRLRLAAINMELKFRANDITLDYAKWVKPYYHTLFETDTFDYMRTVPKIDMTITNLSDEEFFNCLLISQERKLKTNLNSTPTIPKFELLYIDSKYESISLFGESFALTISQLKREIANINNYIELLEYNHKKTFESITDHQREIIEQNIQDTIGSITRETKYLIQLSEKIINQLGV